MESTVAYTEEIDDLEAAVRSIADQVKDFAFRSSSLAIVFAEDETDWDEFYRLLAERFAFPVVGCTAMATLLSSCGFRGVGISVMFLTADDCRFSVGISGELSTANYEDEIAALYQSVSSALPEKPALMLTFGGIVNDDTNVDADYVLARLDQVSDHVPICGALSSDGFTFTDHRIFCNGASAQHAQVIALISGNIQPRAVCVTSMKNRADFSYPVTQVCRNQVFRLGSETLVETLRQADLLVDKGGAGQQMVLGDYILSPFIITMKYPNGDQVEVMRNLSLLNFDSGSGTFLGTVPEGSSMGISLLNRDDAQSTVKACFDRALEIVRSDPEKYRTMLCCTCCARYLALGSNVEGEAKAFEGLLPETVSLIGIYSYGEFCPVPGSRTGTSYNMFHNFTFSILVL